MMTRVKISVTSIRDSENHRESKEKLGCRMVEAKEACCLGITERTKETALITGVLVFI
jgi:hypothetical protein